MHPGPTEVTPTLHSTQQLKDSEKANLLHDMPTIEGLGTHRHHIPSKKANHEG